MESIVELVFDKAHYLRYEDIREAKSKHPPFDPLEHFQEHGVYEGRSPSFGFDLGFVRYKLSRYLGIKVEPPEVIPAFFDLPPKERFVPNGWFNPWAFRSLYARVYPQVGSFSEYELFEYYLANVREGALSPNGAFNEEAYRSRYPEVGQWILEGQFLSGFVHFVYEGAKEGKINLPRFDRQAYIAAGAGETEGDYLLAHHAGLERVVPWFDEFFYLSVYDDVHELKRREVIRSGLEHFLVLGFSEQRIPHPALLSELGQSWFGTAWSFFAASERLPPPRIRLQEASRLLRHLSNRHSCQERSRLAKVIWRYVEPPAVGGTFDEAAYLAANIDVAEGLAGSPTGAAKVHWRNTGISEQRIAPGTNVFAGRMIVRADFLKGCRGVNYFGPLSASSGLGTAARGIVAALRAAEIPLHTYDVSGLISGDLPVDLFAASDLAYTINFVHLNPDRVLPFIDRFGTAIFDYRLNAGYWVWELASPRPEWRAVLSGFDLIVTPSQFCSESFATFTNRPVVTCPHVVDATFLRAELAKSSGNRWIKQVEAAKAAGKCIVLFIMDASSYMIRKGADVFSAIAVRLESEYPGRFTFVLKTHSKDHSQCALGASASCVLVIDEVLKLPDLVKLKTLADVYVSPHRGEGFGLNVLESVILGVPVLCSRYGGPVDQLPEDYPFFIPGRLAEVGRDMGPYRRHAIWFEPSLDAACDALVRMLDNPFPRDRLRRISKRISSQLAPEAVGLQLRQLLELHCGLAPKGSESAAPHVRWFSGRQTDECFEVGLSRGTEEIIRLESTSDAVSLCIYPLFSVITPTHNTQPEFLNELYQDLIAQTFASWEWCLCDDGSSRSETLAALQELRRKDARVRVKFLQHNGGISAATNSAVSMASGAYLVMVDHDDRVHPDLLRTYQDQIYRGKPAVLYCDEDKLDFNGDTCDPFFKPDWSPEHILSVMYVLHCLCIRKSDFLELGGYRSAYDGAQDHDFVLRVAATGSEIRHVDQLLYHWRKTDDSMAAGRRAKPLATEAGRGAVADYLRSIGLSGTVENGLFAGSYRVRPMISRGPISLNILTACTSIHEGRSTYVEQFVSSILKQGSSLDLEIRVVADERRLESAEPLAALDPRVRVVPFSPTGAYFNFAEKANFAVRTSESDRIVLLNDDMEAINAGWLPALLELLELPGVGVVGGRLLHEDETVQHTGIVLGIYGTCAHVFEGLHRDFIGYNGLTHVIRNYAAVTGALMAFRRSTFELVDGFDLGFPIDYNDVDFCLRVLQSGLRVVYTPFSELKHYESRSAKRLVRDELDTLRFRERWSAFIACDPYYNRNLSRDSIMFDVPNPRPLNRAAGPEPATSS